MKDYYEILGVEKTASEDEIKKAFRQKSKIYHPDRQSGKSDAEKKQAEEKMKEINEAYEILSDSEKRQKFDNGGDEFNFGGFDFDLRDFFGGRSSRRENAIPRGSDIQMKVPVSIDEIINGCKKKVKFKRQVRCPQCNGAGGEAKTTCPYCHGTGMISQRKQMGPNSFFETRTVCPHCEGRGYKFAHVCTHCHETGFVEKEEIIEVVFDPGIIQGMPFKAQGRGNESQDPNGIDGNFIAIPIYNVDTTKYNLDNFPHIIHKVKMNWIDALLGGEMQINLEGVGKQTVKIPECTKPDDTIVLHGKGVKVKTSDFGAMQGDYILVVEYQLPSHLSDKEKETLKQLKNKS